VLGTCFGPDVLGLALWRTNITARENWRRQSARARLASDMSGRRPTKDLTTFFVHLNDHHEWSRETIADWLEENGAAEPAPATDQLR